jgi:hypothetical protein
MMVSTGWDNVWSTSRLAVLLPILVVVHLGFVHAEHLRPDLVETQNLGHHASASDHSEPSNHRSADVPAPTSSDEACPIPSASLRSDDQNEETISITLHDEVAFVPRDDIEATPLSSTPPKRLDGPNRRAILQCFLL